MPRQRLPLLLATALVLALLGGAGAWLLWPEPPPPEEPAAEDKDTGLTRDETEELMRTIGYVQ